VSNNAGAIGPDHVYRRKRSDARTILTASRDSSLAKDDAALVAAAKSGDEKAFELLIERHGRMILISALRVTNNREDAEDVVQQCFEKAFVHLKEFQGRSSFSTWLTRIVLNEALMSRRKGRRWREISVDDSNTSETAAVVMEIPDSALNPEEIYCQHERKRILSLVMNELGPGIRAAINICDLNERSISDTARILGLSPNAAKSRVSRGRKALREKFMRYTEQVQIGQRKSAWRRPLAACPQSADQGAVD
jgi:RNA polymerase sigma-70 factor (ECF subfamily)